VEEQELFKDLPEVERKILGHVESFKAKKALINLLTEKYPPLDAIVEAVKMTK